VVLLAEIASGARPLRVLLTGDLDPEGQADLMASTGTMDVDVVKVPHHGWGNQHPGLPGWARAEVAVISCGRENDYGHPAAATVAAWQHSGAQVLRTDEHGDVLVAASDSSVEIRAGRP